MEQRKLIQHGASSLTLSLPMKWVKERGMKKGDEVFVNIEGNKLIVSSENSIDIGKVSVNVTGLDRTSILLYVQSLYRFGYDEIEIIFDKPTTIHYRRNKEVLISSVVYEIINRCVGAEVIEENDKRIRIKNIVGDTGEDFKTILRREFLLVKEASETLFNGIERNDMNLVESIENKHDNINKFTNYCLRLLNKYGYPDVKRTCFYYHIIATIDKIVDILKYNARDILQYNKKFNPKTIMLWKRVHNSITQYYDLFYNFDLRKIDSLSNNRDETKNLIKKDSEEIPVEELMLLTNMKQIMEIILDMTDARMGLEQ